MTHRSLAKEYFDLREHAYGEFDENPTTLEEVLKLSTEEIQMKYDEVVADLASPANYL